MRHLRLIGIPLLASCLAALAAPATFAQPAASTAPPATSRAAFSVPVVYRKLPNGLRVVVSENHAAPAVVVAVMYRSGFGIEPRIRTGRAHRLEHILPQ